MLAAIALTASVIISPGADSIKMSPTPTKPMCLMNVDAKTIVNAKDITGARIAPSEVHFLIKGAEPVVVKLTEGQDGFKVMADFMDRVAETCK